MKKTSAHTGYAPSMFDRTSLSDVVHATEDERIIASWNAAPHMQDAVVDYVNGNPSFRTATGVWIYVDVTRGVCAYIDKCFPTSAKRSRGNSRNVARADDLPKSAHPSKARPMNRRMTMMKKTIEAKASVPAPAVSDARIDGGIRRSIEHGYPNACAPSPGEPATPRRRIASGRVRTVESSTRAVDPPTSAASSARAHRNVCIGTDAPGTANAVLMRLGTHDQNGDIVLRHMERVVLEPYRLNQFIAPCYTSQCVARLADVVTPSTRHSGGVQEKALSTALLLAIGRRVADVQPHASVIHVNLFGSMNTMRGYAVGDEEHVGHWRDSLVDANCRWTPSHEPEGLHRHTHAWRTPITREVLAWTRYRDDAWPAHSSDPQQPFWWCNEDESQQPRIEFWGASSTLTLWCGEGEGDAKADLFLTPQAHWLADLPNAPSDVDAAYRLVLVRCWITTHGVADGGVQCLALHARQCLPLAIVHCVAAPWFTTPPTHSVVQSAAALNAMERTVATASAVLDAYLHGTYAACVHEINRGDMGVPTPMTCTCNAMNDVYAQCLQRYVTAQKGVDLRVIWCHRVRNYHFGQRHLSFLTYKFGQYDAANTPALYKHLFLQYCVSTVDDGDEPTTRGGCLARALSTPYVQAGERLSTTPRVFYQSPCASDVVAYAIKNKFGHGTSAQGATNEAFVLMVSSETDLPRPTRRSVRDIEDDVDMCLESALRVSVHDCMDEVSVPEFYARR